MTTTANSNYGGTLTFNGAAVGACMVLDYPEIATGKAVTTNHAGGGVAESIPNGLVSLGDFTISVILTAGLLAGIKTSIVNKTVASVVLTDAVETMTFSGYYLSAKKEAADATSPDTIKATVVIAATGGITF